MNDADYFAAQDTAHDNCESYCGFMRMGVECPAPEIEERDECNTCGRTEYMCPGH
jgi:hypothetical protein